ncbi:MAG: autotransporter domain-containing protein [Woeseiaceae bacterium]|nr:autotransporter domain-containing protein [Woeseiaceae bacterium]
MESVVGTVTEEVCSWVPNFLGFLIWVCEEVVKPVTDTLVNEGEEIAVRTVQTNGAAAYGIWTGTGDDLIINTGNITAGTVVNGASGLGIGIRTGAGNDVLRFGDGSSVSGHVWLESGDDTLALWGSSTVTGITNGGAGTDTLDMYGAGSFSGALATFEAAAKHQAGTFTLHNALPALDSISVHEGILAFGSSYSMGVESSFMTQVNADGSHSRFEVAGNLGLDGTLSVAKDDGLFVDGARYDVITANEIDGAFHTFDLPDPTSMLSFAVEQSDTEVDVVVSVESLAGFAAADNPLAQSMGGYMDTLTASASGEIATVLTILQHSDDRELVADTLAAITPSDRENTVTGSLAALRRSQDAVHERLAAIRSGAAGKSHLGGDSAVNLFAGDGSQPGRPGGLWVATMSFDGGQPAGKQPAFASENYLFGGGVDLPLGERFVVGGSVFAGFSNLQHERMNDASEMKSVLGSLYGSFAGQGGYYAQGVVSAGPTDYRSFRHLDTAIVSRLVESDHTGDVLAAGVETGRSFRHGRFDSEWFAGVNYVDLTEHAFEESGGGSLGFAAQGAEAESLVSELGIRSAIEIERPWGIIRPRVSLAWLHEHDIGADTLTGHLLGAPDSSFTFRHDRAGDDGYRLSLGFEVQSDENGYFTLKWNEEKLGSYADSSVLARIGMRF